MNFHSQILNSLVEEVGTLFHSEHPFLIVLIHLVRSCLPAI